MNITPQTVSLPLATVVNPPTEGLRRENHQREIITQVTAANPSAAEKGVASGKEHARTPAQVNPHVDFANLRKQAENDASSITEQGDQQGKQSKEEQQEKTNSSTSENDIADEESKQVYAAALAPANPSVQDTQVAASAV